MYPKRVRKADNGIQWYVIEVIDGVDKISWVAYSEEKANRQAGLK